MEIDAPFTPSVIENDGAVFTEMVIRDAPTVWVHTACHALGYDMETGDLIAIRLPGHVARWQRRQT